MPTLIKLRGKQRWRGVVRIGEFRKEKTFPDNTRKSEKLAMAWEIDVKRKLQRETSIPTVFLTLDEWVKSYLDNSKIRHSSKTYGDHQRAFRLFCKNLNPDMLVDTIPKDMVVNFVQELYQSKSGHAANKYCKLLARSWRWGERYIEHFPKNKPNPFDNVDRMPEQEQPRYVPPEKDFWAVYNICQHQDQVMLLTFLHLAARRKEVFKIKISDIDFKGMKIKLTTRKRKDGRMEYDWIPMTSELKSAIIGWLEVRLKHHTEDKEHVFVCLDKKNFCKQYFGKPFTNRQHFMKKACKKAGVKHFGFHAIRHLSATILYQNGYDLSFIQTILRHKNPNTTARYLHRFGLSKMGQEMEKVFSGRNSAKVVPLKTFFESK